MRKGKPEFNSDASFRDPGVDSSGITVERPKHEISAIGTTSGRIDSDRRCDRTASMVMEAEIDKVSDGEESSAEGGADDSTFLVGIVRAARDVVACSNQSG